MEIIFLFSSLLFCKKRFLNLVLAIIALEMSLLMKGLFSKENLPYIAFLGACLSKISVQIVENTSSAFSFRNCPCTLSSCLDDSMKACYESPYISNN